MYKFIFLLLILTPFLNVLAQPKAEERHLQGVFYQNYELAQKAINMEDYESAIPFLRQLDSLSPGNANINYNLGMCYINSFLHKKKALPHLLIAKDLISANYEPDFRDTTASLFTLYYLAQAFLIEGDLNTAVDYNRKFNHYINKYYAPLYYTEKSADEVLSETERQLEIIYNAKKFMANPVQIKVEKLSDVVNSEFNEYTPIISGDGKTLIFTSRRDNTTGKARDRYTNDYKEDIYITEFDVTTGAWSPTRNIGEPVNTNENEAAVSLSEHGKLMIIYRKGDLFLSRNLDGAWQKPTSMGPEINSKEIELYACFGEDSNTIFFSSNRKGGYGGFDLWVTRRKPDGNWMKAQNMGKTINTAHDEIAPYYQSIDQSLYFSSGGHENMGCMDIFKTYKNKKGYWERPENLGFPINTTDDDIYFSVSGNGTYSYFSSPDEDNPDDLDIYRITMLTKVKQLTIKGIIVNSETKEPINASVIVIDKEARDTLGYMSSKFETGRYFVTLPYGREYLLHYIAPRYKEFKLGIQVNDNNMGQEIFENVELEPYTDFVAYVPQTIEQQFKPDKIMAPKRYIPVEHREEYTDLTYIEIEEILNNADTIPSAVDNGNNSPHTGVSGNMDRILLSNQVVDSVQPEVARTTDVLVTSTVYLTKPTVDLTTKDLPVSATSIYSDLEKAGNKISDGQAHATSMHVSRATATINETLLNSGPETIELKGILFPYSLSTVTEESKSNLGKLVKFMKNNTSVSIHIAGHTDNVGSDIFNQQLSEARAQAVYNYLAEKGIDKKRMTYKGYGESEPTAANETEEGRAKNRRIEFSIIK